MRVLSRRVLALGLMTLTSLQAQDPLLERKMAENCTLDCRNDGTCTLGQANFGFANELEDENPLPFAEQEHTQFCSCPAEYTGLQCEIKFVTCGARSHTCFNGGECALDETDAGDTFFHCECDPAQSDLSRAYAGHFCQHHATQMCTTDNSTNHSFCTNGGECREMVEADQEHMGCDCPNGWEGSHCEFVKANTSSSLSTGAVVGITAAVAVVTVAAVAVVARLVHKRRHSKSDAPEFPMDEPPISVSDEPESEII